MPAEGDSATTARAATRPAARHERPTGRAGPGPGGARRCRPRPSSWCWWRLLCVVGLVMVGSASDGDLHLASTARPWAILVREAMWMVVGAAGPGVAVPVRLPPVAPAALGAAWWCTFVLLGGRAGPGHRGALAGLEPLDRLRPAPAPALRADEAGPGRVRRRPGRAARRAGRQYRTDRRAPVLGDRRGGRARSWSSPTWAPPWSSAASPWPCSSPRACRMGPVIKLLAAGRRAGPGRRGRRPVPAGPAALVPRPRRPRLGLGLPGGPVAHRPGFGAPVRARARRGPPEVGLPAQRPHRLHLLGDRGGARA